jgi:transposase-like protein
MTPEFPPSKSPRPARTISTALVVPRRRWSAAEKEHLLACFERSGQSASQFCRDMGLCQPTFSAWRRQAAPTVSAAPTRFAAVHLAASSPPTAPHQVAIHCPDGSTVVAAVGADPRWLGELARALR